MYGGNRGVEWQNPALWLSAGETVPGDGRMWGSLVNVFRNHPSKHREQILIVSLLGWALSIGRLSRAFPLIETSWMNTDLNVGSVCVLSRVCSFPLLCFVKKNKECCLIMQLIPIFSYKKCYLHAYLVISQSVDKSCCKREQPPLSR